MKHEKLTAMMMREANDLDAILRRIRDADSPIAVYVVDGQVRATYYTLGLVRLANAGDIEVVGVYGGDDGKRAEADVAAALSKLLTKHLAAFGRKAAA